MTPNFPLKSNPEKSLKSLVVRNSFCAIPEQLVTLEGNSQAHNPFGVVFIEMHTILLKAMLLSEYRHWSQNLKAITWAQALPSQ